MEGFDRLVDDLDGGFDIRRGYEPGDLVGDLLGGKRMVNAFHYILRMQVPGTLQFLAMLIIFLKTIVPATFLHQFDGGTEGDEISHFAHIDAIAIGVSDLGRGGENDDLPGFETGQHPDDAFPKSSPTHDGVVDDDEGIDTFPDSPIG